MDDAAWDRAIAAALKHSGSTSSPKTLNLDGAFKCAAGRLPSPGLLERYPTIEELSLTGARLNSLDGFPRLPALRRLVLSDNRVSSGLSALSVAGLTELRDLDLSNNRIAEVAELAPLAELPKLESLDLFACPVTKKGDYRAKVFRMIPSLKFLDNADVNGEDRADSDEDDDEDEVDEEDGGSEEVEEEVDDDDGEGEEDSGSDDGEQTVDDEDDDEDEDDEGDEPEVEDGDDEEDEDNDEEVNANGAHGDEKEMNGGTTNKRKRGDEGKKVGKN